MKLETLKEIAPAEIVAEFQGRDLLRAVAACRNGTDRLVLSLDLYAKEMTPKREAFRVAVDWAMARGLVKLGTDNAMAKAWNTFGCAEGSLYLTKAGRAWLKTRAYELEDLDWNATCARLMFGPPKMAA